MSFTNHNSFTWANVCRQANGEKIVQIEDDTWVPEGIAKLTGEKLVKHVDGTWMTASYAKNNIFNIMALPTELQRDILSHCIEDDYLSVYLHSRYSVCGITLPNIAYATKLLRLQFISVLLQNTTFSIHNGAGNAKFQVWLSKINLSSVSPNYTTGFDGVKKLDFPYFSRFPHQIYKVNNDIELMLKCKNLEVVDMDWVFSELIDPATHRGKTVQQLRDEYRLDGMCGLKKLRKLVLRRRGSDAMAENVLQELAEWFAASIDDGTDARKAPVVEIV